MQVNYSKLTKEQSRIFEWKKQFIEKKTSFEPDIINYSK